MFAGKSEELIRQLRRASYARKSVQTFKHAIDDRYDSAEVRSHEGARLEAAPVSNSGQLEKLIRRDTAVIGIEEAQFFDQSLIELVTRLSDRGRTVIVAGLDQDFRRQPFGIMPQLMAIADEVIKLRAICMQCGRDASHTQRLVDGKPARWDDPIVLVGAAERYEARCRACHKVLGVPAKNGPRKTERAAARRKRSAGNAEQSRLWSEGRNDVTVDQPC